MTFDFSTLFDFNNWWLMLAPDITAYTEGLEEIDYLYILSNNIAYLIFLIEIIITLFIIYLLFHLFKTLCYAIWSCIK